MPHLPEEDASRADLEPGNLLVDAGGSELLLHVTRPLAREDDWSVLKTSSRSRSDRIDFRVGRRFA